MGKIIKKYDKNNNEIYWKYGSLEYWWEYDENNNCIYFKNIEGFEIWYKYDENNNEIYYRDSDGREFWYKHGENNIYAIEITEKEFNEIEFRKQENEYLSRKKVSRFELIDI